jgi:isoleucyl-tRNA synthetase
LAAVTAAGRHPLIPPRSVDPRQELPALELDVLQRWRERAVFAESLRRRNGAEQWVFYEGPPTANGRPGAHHVLSRVFKDIYPRYKTMRGYRVERKGGWDCHGLPVEIAVEQELGLSSKAEIEQYGIERFNARCRESVFAYLEDWDRLTERIGFWVDLDGAYRTLDESYIESVWWALAEIDRKGLLYEGHKVVPYCPRCGTALSSHEVALGYRDVVDPSVFIKLQLIGSEDKLLVWTTTPWTLPGNVAVAVADIDYLRVRRGGETLVVAEALAERVLGTDLDVVGRYTGRELDGREYEGPIFPLQGSEPAGRPVLRAGFVTTEDGTGIVHIAPAFGEDDFQVATAAGIEMVNPVMGDGTFDSSFEPYAGRFVKDRALTEELIADLQAGGLLFKREDYEHSYPHCWRCGTPLIYYAKPSWYIATSRIREQMLAANETVNWYPPHIKHGRFGDWLQGNVDWALSRERYWGTPLPVWRCGEGHMHTIGSFAELERLSGTTLSDHHRPFVDEVSFACTHESCSEPMRRVPEVIDVWFDSGAMPFAQHHAPFAGAGADADAGEGLDAAAARFAADAARFPAAFICEALDQTRGWFYSLLAVSTLLFDRSSYENVVCLGLILDSDGQKMSKSRGNTVEPWQVIDGYGADAFRWYFFTSKQPWDGYRFSEEAIGDGVRLFLKQLWSTYFFYVLYAHANRQALMAVGDGLDGAALGGGLSGAPAVDERPLTDRRASSPAQGAEDLDRWALSRTTATAATVAERLDAYDATAAGRAIAALVDDLSNWYVRRSRRRFWDGDPAAFQTLRQCLTTIAKLLAPFCPFIADEIYDNLDGELESVHLCDFPAGATLPPRDEQLEAAMATARETVRLGLGARAQAKIKVRQPLAEAVVVADGPERAAIERLSEIVRDELNVRTVRFVAGAEELGAYEVKANYRTLGPLFGREMPLAAKAIAALDPSAVAAAVLAGAEGGGGAGIGIAVGGREHTLSAEDVLLSMKAPEGYSVEREGSHAVALDLTLDDSLLREGRSREIVHAVQNARKTAGLQVEDRIELLVAGDPELIEAAREHEGYLSGETLAVSVAYDGERSATAMDYSEQTELEGMALQIALSRA